MLLLSAFADVSFVASGFLEYCLLTRSIGPSHLSGSRFKSELPKNRGPFFEATIGL